MLVSFDLTQNNAVILAVIKSTKTPNNEKQKINKTLYCVKCVWNT